MSFIFVERASSTAYEIGSFLKKYIIKMDVTLLLLKRDNGLSKYCRVESCTFYVLSLFCCPLRYIFVLKEHFLVKDYFLNKFSY